MSQPVRVTVGDRVVSLTNMDKVLYPKTGFTKAQVIDYYARVTPVLLPHIERRCLSMRRWPDGVESDSFFTKRCPAHRPAWVEVALGPGDGDEGIEYCQINEPAAVVWAANLAALELHAPMARVDAIESPTIVVFDLDPGEPATITECCQIALAVRDILDAVGLKGWPKTSGSKGLQIYVPLNTACTHRQAADFALAVGHLVVRDNPDKALVEMTKTLRTGKVFIDWSQNVRYKTTVAPYSLRANPKPTVSTPLAWDEIAAGSQGQPLVFGPDDVVARIADLGDLFAPVATFKQQLPTTN